MGCSCPKPTALTAIAATTCEINLKEVWKLWVVRAGAIVWNISTPTSNVGVASGAVPTADTDWVLAKAKSDDTKVVVLPQIGNEPKLTPGGELSTVGLSNRKIHQGFEPSDFSAMLEGLTAAQEKNVNLLTCEGDDLEVYMVLYDKRIVGVTDAATSNLFTGIPLASAITLAGRSINGFNDSDKNEIQFQLPQDWSHNLHIITPAATFNTLTF